MTDERRWKIYVCPGCGTVTDYDRSTGCGACEDGPMTVPVVVVPVSSVVPITRLREVLDQYRDIVGGMYAVRAKDPVTACGVLRRGMADATRLRAALLDELECASNPNNERTTDA